METPLSVPNADEAIGVSVDTIRRTNKNGLYKTSRPDQDRSLFGVSKIRKLQEKNVGKNTARKFKTLKSKRKTEYTVIELFAGAGGTALGFENAGLKHTLLVDVDKDCVATLKSNRPEWNVAMADVRNYDFKGPQADIVEGGFPCQAFSEAGRKMGFNDTRGTLFFELARCVKEVQPKIFMGENVKGLLTHDKGKTLAVVISVLSGLGYKVAYKVLRSQYLDVAQRRERLVILGVRNDLDLPLLFPKEQDYTLSIKEALENVPLSRGQQYPKRKKDVLDLVPQGGNWRDLPIELQKEYMQGSFYSGGGKTGMARRLSWDEPGLTLTCSPAQKQTEGCHPEETRPLTIREYARIQSFPDEWQFQGSISSQYKQIGNAVPVNLGYHIGRCLIAMLENKPDLKTMEMAEPRDST